MVVIQLVVLLLLVAAVILTFIRAFVSDVRGWDLGWLGMSFFLAATVLQTVGG